MSAICGIINFDGQPVREDQLPPMLAAMKDWGPDGFGTWVNGNLGMGSLLFRVTPESVDEKQPVFGADGQVILVCDARLDNRDELGPELGVPASAPDSDFIMSAYLKWGERCARHLIGDFSLAIWDNRSRSLLLATDHLAARPLFYVQSGRRIVFASSFFGIFAACGMPDLVEDQLINYLLVRPGEKGATFYQGVYRVPAGHTVVVRDGVLRRDAYWRVEDIPDIRYPRDEDYVEAFRECFARAVKACCRSRLPVGLMLSSGLDSSSVAVVANRLLKARGERLRAYCSVPLPGFDGSAFRKRLVDESPLVELLRKQEDFDVRYIAAEGRSPWTDFLRNFEALGRPPQAMRNRHWLWSILEQARDDGVGVVLNGQMGNATISWAGAGYLGYLLRHGDIRTWCREVWRRPGWRGCLSGLRETAWLLRPRSACTLWSVLGRDQTCRRTYLRPDHRRARHMAGLDGAGLTFTLRPDPRENRQAMLLGAEDIGEFRVACNAFAHVEERDPTADRSLLELTLGIPEHAHVRDGQSRLMVRRAFATDLPAPILAARRRGLQAADAAERLSRDLPEMRKLAQELEGHELVRRLLDLQRLRAALSQLEQGGAPDKLPQLDRLLAALAIGGFCHWFAEQRKPADF